MSLTAELAAASPTVWRPLRLETLVRLRWLAIAGQALSIIAIDVVLDYPLPLWPCLSLVGLSMLVNFWLSMRHGAGDRPSSRSAVLQLGYDSLQLSALLALTGGLVNPFSVLLVAPVAVAATTLSRRYTIALAALVAVEASALAVLHLPLPWNPAEPIKVLPLYVFGIWMGIVCAIGFVSVYVMQVAYEARQLAGALSATELALSLHERLSALDGLAAAAAHELGTPLSTIALAAKEMRNDVPDGPLADDVDLIISQAARCRAILGKLRDLGNGEVGADPFESVPLGDLIDEVAQPHLDRGKEIIIRTDGSPGPEPVVRRATGVMYGFGNFIENATDFARSEVVVTTRWTAGNVEVTITDDGPGFPPDLLARLGEPYLTTRPSHDPEDDSPDHTGLGLGVFIAKTLLERSGASVSFFNANEDGHATVRILWPRRIIDQGPKTIRHAGF